MSTYRSAPEEDVVLSSRVRLARNYEDIPFAPVMNREWSDETIRRAEAAIAASDEGAAFTLSRMRDLEDERRRQLVEQHLISDDLLKFIELSAALISSGRTVSVMINEEDHLRIQGLLPGLQVERSAELAFQADGWLGADHPYAFDRQLGYLTSCPTNTGTGMRASAMLHLPALTLANQMASIVQTVGKLGMTVRGIYGEGSEALGHLYQLSNQVTLGRSEEDIIKSLLGATAQISASERKVRKTLIDKDRLVMEDKMMRSLSVMRSARLMEGNEFMGLYSDVRFAASLGMIKIPLLALDRLMMAMQPASLSVAAEKALDERAEKEFRALRLREEIAALLR